MQSQIKGSSVDDVKKLLPTEYQGDAEHVHTAIQKAMSLQGDNQASNSVRFIENTNGHFYTEIDLNTVPEQHWQFSVANGRATFTELTADEAEAIFAQYPPESDFTPVGSFWDWLGDIFEGVKHAVETVIKFTISVVKKVVVTIKAAIECVINGIKYVFNGTIKFIEQAFRTVEAIFNAVKVFFKDLFDFFGWLLTGARQDIWNTKIVIENSMTKLFPELEKLAKQGITGVDKFFTDLEANIDSYFDEVIQYLGNKTFDYKSEEAVLSYGDNLSLSPHRNSQPEDNNLRNDAKKSLLFTLE